MKTTTKYKYSLLAFIIGIGYVIIKLWLAPEMNLLSQVFGTIGLLVLVVAALLKMDQLSDGDKITRKKKIVFTHLWVKDFGWENTIFLPEDFKDVGFYKSNGDGSIIFRCTQDNGKVRTLKGYYE